MMRPCRICGSPVSFLLLCLLMSCIQQENDGLVNAKQLRNKQHHHNNNKEYILIEDLKQEESQVWGRILGHGGSSMSMMKSKPPSGRTLLAIGDSLCTGQLPEPRNTIFFSDEGYVDNVFDYVQDEYDFNELEKVCCPAEDSSELIDGNFDDPPSDGSFCYGDEAPLGNSGLESQLDAAVAVLESGDVGLITISIGANDVFPCVFAPNAEDCVRAQIPKIVTNLEIILDTLVEASPDEELPPMVAMTPYNPVLAFYLSDNENEQELVPISQMAILALHSEMKKVYDEYDIPVVFAHEVFHGLDDSINEKYDIPENVASICKYVGMCNEEDGTFTLKDEETRDIHPYPDGYEKLGEAHFEVVDELLDY